MVTYEALRRDAAVNTYITRADESLSALGFTEHSFPHVCRVAEVAGQVLKALGYDSHQIELAKIAAYLHDIGNLVNRVDHSQSGAVMAFRILDHMDMGTGVPVNAVAAALILAAKSDVRRNRVRNRDIATFDIHDRVNYSVERSELRILPEEKVARLELTVDTHFSSVMDFFEIFLKRMLLCRRAAERLGVTFQLTINGQQVV